MSYCDTQAHMVGGADPSFESFIDSDLILDTNSSPAPTPGTPMSKKEARQKPSALSALPSRLSLANGTLPGSPGPMSEFLSYSQSSTSSVTTPTTSNSSSLHNLNFDFFDEGETDSNSAVNQTMSDALASPQADSSSASLRQYSLTPTAIEMMPTTAHSPLFSGQIDASSGLPFAAQLDAAVQPLVRSVDDMGHQLGQPMHHHPAHHQRSLSLRDVAPSLNNVPPAFFPNANAASTPFTFASAIKMEPGLVTSSNNYEAPNHMSSVPASESHDDDAGPRQGKKRRISSKAKGEGVKANTARASTGSARKSATVGRRKSSAKDETPASESNHGTQSQDIDAASLIENRQMPTPRMGRGTSSCRDDEPMDETLERDTSRSVSASMFDDEIGDDSMSCEGVQKVGTKRAPPSASQVTEAGMPFPVIDTSAKHSSLFVPPDTSGLTKREARLVKNRAAAFLSRQRKREQFEELDIKCRNLCRLVWKLWLLGNEAANGKKAAQKNSAYADHAKLSGALLDSEGADVREIFDMVLMLKGGSIAPTEDGQLQGAVAAGLQSVNGKIVDDAGSAISVPSSAAQAAEEASRTVARLRAELDEQRKREASLQAELANERALRMKMEFDAKQREQEQRPFRNGGVNGNLSLTVPATFDEDDDDDDDDNDDVENIKAVGGTRTNARANGRANGNGRSRTSQRLQRQSSSLSIANGTANAPNQRKAASAALMMVLFSFALFGMPGSKVGQSTMMGGMSRTPGSSSDAFPLGPVLTAPVIGGGTHGEEEEEMAKELQSHLPPSSHLSIDDLFPSTQQMQDLLRDAESGRGSRDSLHRSIRDALKDHGASESASDSAVDFSMDYKAFAKDLSSSLDWDMQGGFLVLGSGGDDHDGAEKADGANDVKRTGDYDGKEDLTAGSGDAPTKLTLFVPAPRERSTSPEMDAAEDRFYDAPLATEGGKQTDATAEYGGSARELSQAEATRAALQVLRNHRVAREAAAFAASRHVVGGSKPSPYVRMSSPTRSVSPVVSGEGSTTKDVRMTADEHADEDEEQDFSQEMQQSGTKNADQIRGTDFYQLEFSLSGAKVRNVAELTRLFGSMRNKRTE